MFEKYDSYSPPNNISSGRVIFPTKLSIAGPRVKKDPFGNIVAFSWMEDDRFQFTFPNYLLITIPSTSLVLSEHSMIPSNDQDEYTYAYNTKDSRCWQFVSPEWKELDYIYCEVGSSWSIQLEVGSKRTRMEITDFRGNIVLEQNDNIFDSTALKDVLPQGAYTLTMYLVDENDKETVYTVDLSCRGHNSLLQGDFSGADCSSVRLDADVGMRLSELESNSEAHSEAIEAMLDAPLLPGNTVFASITNND